MRNQKLVNELRTQIKFHRQEILRLEVELWKQTGQPPAMKFHKGPTVKVADEIKAMFKRKDRVLPAAAIAEKIAMKHKVKDKYELRLLVIRTYTQLRAYRTYENLLGDATGYYLGNGW